MRNLFQTTHSKTFLNNTSMVQLIFAGSEADFWVHTQRGL